MCGGCEAAVKRVLNKMDGALDPCTALSPAARWGHRCIALLVRGAKFCFGTGAVRPPLQQPLFVHMAVLQLTSAMKVSCLCSAYAGRRAEADAVRYHAGVESFDISVPDKKVRHTASLPWATVQMYLPSHQASQQLVMVVVRAVVCKMCNIHACGVNTWTPLCQCYWIKSAECTSWRLSRLLCCICRS